jgi:hypothetical protein
MVKQHDDTALGSSEVKKIVSDEVKPLLEKLTDLETSYANIISMIYNFNKNSYC